MENTILGQFDPRLPFRTTDYCKIPAGWTLSGKPPMLVHARLSCTSNGIELMELQRTFRPKTILLKDEGSCLHTLATQNLLYSSFLGSIV